MWLGIALVGALALPTYRYAVAYHNAIVRADFVFLWLAQPVAIGPDGKPITRGEALEAAYPTLKK